MTGWLAALGVVVLVSGCGAVPARPAGPAPASPAAADVGGAVDAATRAQEALRLAYAHADERPLSGLFTGEALVAIRRDLAAMAARGARREEEVESRAVLHQAVEGSQAEVVIEVHARDRLISGGSGSPFVSVLRQWRAHLRQGVDGWVVDAAADLRPDQWWPVPGGAS